MKKLLILLLFFATFLNAGTVTNTTTKKAYGEGYGTSYNEALNRALADAVGRLNGANLSSKSSLTINSVKSNKGNDFKKTYNDEIKKSTRGRYDSYDVVSKVKTSDGYKVKVLIKRSRTTKRYKTPGFNPHNRRKIAIIPSYSGRRFFNILGQRYLYRKVAFDLTQELVSSVTQSRKFTVLDREAREAYESEKHIILTDGARDEALKLGQVLGTDYLFVSNITDYDLQKNVKKSDITGVISRKVKVNATIKYRIIAMATRQVKYSNTENFSFDVDGDSDEQYILNSFKIIAKSLTDDILNNIYPIKIAGKNGNEVILSQKLTVGEIYDVFSLGKRIRDSYTKESVGRVESKIGSIEITRVTPKISYGKIIQGKANKGNLCRLVSSSQTKQLRPDVTEEEKPSDVKIKDGGGVVLPFD